LYLCTPLPKQNRVAVSPRVAVYILRVRATN
jgi:hypothetical protein